MNLNTLQAFRHEAYDSFQRAADVLFTTADALLSESQANSFPELSLSPFFERCWPSLYEAFEDGCTNTLQLQEVFVRLLPALPETERLWLGIDASSIARPESQTSADRSVVHVLLKVNYFAHLGNRLPMNCVIVALAAETRGTWDAGRADDSWEKVLFMASRGSGWKCA